MKNNLPQFWNFTGPKLGQIMKKENKMQLLKESMGGGTLQA